MVWGTPGLASKKITDKLELGSPTQRLEKKNQKSSFKKSFEPFWVRRRAFKLDQNLQRLVLFNEFD